MKRTLTSFLLIICLLLGITAGSAFAFAEPDPGVESPVSDSSPFDSPEPEPDSSGTTPDTQKEIKIVYTNDIHSYVDNTKKDEQGNTVPALRLSNVAALVSDLKNEGYPVLLADAGDSIQGTAYGSMDQGESVISLMNAAGYDVAVPGNHDFDYGADSFISLTALANFPYVCCDFFTLPDLDRIFPAYKIFDLNGTRIGVIGITTPEAQTKSSPQHYRDESGHFKYMFPSVLNTKLLYGLTQMAIDVVSEQADYVIALGHMGIGLEAQRNGYSSIDLIANTHGLDAFIDGHSHTVMKEELVKDDSGNEVLLTQTGSGLSHVGILTITSDGSLRSELISDYSGCDSQVAALEDELISKLNATMGEEIGVFKTGLYISNPDQPEQRLVRSMEMNSGDFITDAIYWNFNENLHQDCDIVFQVSGGIRTDLPEGTVTKMDLKKVQPFGNQVCLIKVTGQQILYALEHGATNAGQLDLEHGTLAENPALLQAAGLKYTIDNSIPSSTELDQDGNFKGVNGDYRVKDVMVYNRENGAYDPLDLEKEYTLGGFDFLLLEGGDGYSVFKQNELILDYAFQDLEGIIQYIRSFPEKDGLPYVSSEGSPLSGYENYLLDYDNPLGSGRITILNTDK